MHTSVGFAWHRTLNEGDTPEDKAEHPKHKADKAAAKQQGDQNGHKDN